MEHSASDPPPISFSPPTNMGGFPFGFSPQPGVNLPANTHQPRPLGHPPYEEMIRRAIISLNEREGSSRQKIAKYIESEFQVPQSSSHTSELTQELRKMKTYGQVVLVRHSYMLPNSGPPQPPSLPSTGPSVQPFAGPSVQPFAGTPVHSPAAGAYVQSSLAPASAPDGLKRRPGRPPKLQPVFGSSVVTPTTLTQSASPPVGFAAFSPKQLGVPTTNLFGGFTSAASTYQFGAGPNVSTTALVTGPVNNAATLPPVNGPLNGVPTITLPSGPVTNVPVSEPVANAPSTSPVSGPVTNVPSTSLVSGPNNVPATSGLLSNALLTNSVSGPMNHVPATGLVSESNVSSISPLSGHVSNLGPVSDPDALVKLGTSEQIDESAGVEVDSVMVGNGPESTAGPIVASAAEDPAVAQINDGPLLVVSSVPDSVPHNNIGPSTVLGKRGRGRPPKLNGVPKKVWGRPAMYANKKGPRGRPRGRPKPVPTYTMSLRPRGRPRKDPVGAIVTVDQAHAGGNVSGGVMPAAKIHWEPHGNSLGRPTKDVQDAGSLTSEIYLMAYHGLKARIEHYRTRIKSAVSVIQPYLHESAVTALGALQDLEDLANMELLSVPINSQTAVNVQGAPGDDLNTPVNVKDVATENIQSLPLTGEDAQLTFQGRQTDAETAQVTFQSAAEPVQGQQQEPHPLQS
ncbi:uncharacterized protein LOC108217560 [Daucus carota subsp. sativus]|uniref:uncharacterized protein LOC108217560 n=1 Tax=Daucus carota subsp. sativus TaxID=79200 RepID=UPI0007EF5331|nr:PREDICTED: mucin-17-like [Daucus carota subsp. sativus]